MWKSQSWVSNSYADSRLTMMLRLQLLRSSATECFAIVSRRLSSCPEYRNHALPGHLLVAPAPALSHGFGGETEAILEPCSTTDLRSCLLLALAIGNVEK